MTAGPLHHDGCDWLREVAPDVALGLLTGEERAAALAHLERCDACRAEVAALAGAADEILLAAPEATPPAGFDRRVLAALAEHPATAERQAALPGHRRRRRATAAVALAVAAVLLAVVGFAVVARDDDPSPEIVATTEMRTGRDTVVGEATMTGSDPVQVDVDMPDWDDLVERWDEGEAAGTYWLRVETRDGERTIRPATGDDTPWTVTVDAPADEVATVSVVDDEGRVWCSGRFDL